MHMHALPVAPKRSYCVDTTKNIFESGAQRSLITNSEAVHTRMLSQRNLQFLVMLYKQGTFVASYTHFSLLRRVVYSPNYPGAELSVAEIA
jgi:hypothetical protein